MAHIELSLSGVVMVDGKEISGRWHRVRLGAGYFEDPGVLSTDTMSLAALRRELSDMYGESKEASNDT